jgi:phospholipid/cholesterol/gamma-HCH transport system substrate-binding protein
MERERRLSLVVGAFFLLALGGFAVMILSLSARTGVWTRHYDLVTRFGDVKGLIGSAPVRLAGKRVGQVKSVSFDAEDPDRPGLLVVMQIDQEVQERIRTDSVATIGSAGLLGDRVIEISLGTPRGEMLRDGDELASVDPLDLNVTIDKGARALDNVAILAANLNSLVEEFDEESSGKRLAESVTSFGDMIVEVQEGEGLLHSLIYDTYEGTGVQSIEGSLATLERILREIDQGEGVLHSLIYDKPTEQDVILEAIEAGARLNSILAKIDRGEGTFGLMLNDPTLYEEIKILVGGANRSGVVRTMIRMMSQDGE